ncbi:NCS2 family permease [Desmospora profundinema]|uniref:AGZA family xanthine/uracil permease-like MFS transporter n=1 Tax=Desmospora profundinema TaxID=1571184 RepID=A0ABU1IMI1_9BACL|nr:NCS2 family permease [Desmospora profundinema]MDR6225995.1 AGZA family xanthine/uracil permease-like MFS transporter [Desmospora profundinema]
MKGWLEHRFELKNHGSDWRREWTAGMTSFFTAAYIIVVNPLILQDAGIPIHAGTVATVTVSVLGCLLMAFWANAPIILIPGMGVNAFFSHTLVQSLGLDWKEGLAAVTLSGILFLVAATTPLGRKWAQAVPPSLQNGITAGIGLFLTFIGLQKAEWIRPDADTFIALGDFSRPVAWITLVGLVVTMLLYARRTTGSLLIGIAVTAGLSLAVGVTGEAASAPNVTAWGGVVGQLHIPWLSVAFWAAVGSMTMIVVFENIGLLNGMLPSPEQFPRAYQATAVSTVASGMLGTSPVIASAESASGIAAGGRIGLTSLVTAIGFGLSLMILPVIGAIPPHAAAPVLIVIGALMMQSVQRIPFSDFSEGFPAFLIIACIPLTSSIADGLALGFIAYPLVKGAMGQRRQVSPWVYLIAGLFLVHMVAGSLIH